MTSRFHTVFRIGCASALAFFCTLAVAQTWRWTDPATGHTRYSDSPPAGRVKNLVRIGRAGMAEENLDMPYATRLASQKYPVTLYTGLDCEPCNSARQLLGQRKVPFTERSIQSDAEKEELKSLIGDSFVPTLRVGAQQKVRGFDAAAYNNLLDFAGYPKAPAGATTPTPAAAPAPAPAPASEPVPIFTPEPAAAQ